MELKKAEFLAGLQLHLDPMDRCGALIKPELVSLWGKETDLL